MIIEEEMRKALEDSRMRLIHMAEQWRWADCLEVEGRIRALESVWVVLLKHGIIGKDGVI